MLVPGPLGEKVTGPEIRAWALATGLAARHDVTAAVPGAAEGEREGVRVVPWTRARVLRESLAHDAVVSACFPPYLLALKATRRLIAISDQYDPVELELSTLH